MKIIELIEKIADDIYKDRLKVDNPIPIHFEVYKKLIRFFKNKEE